eukprot:TRINITY_DN9422_c0_g1_i3.p1 TRINITY_DN9422_c0_g1~~TRINITY_DN9422_c0_g1_i3.p1  ORF type:complete len:1109 (+),score=334.57 TRINITY_DN9422_c0_g1_i3:150-3476(+)
MPGKNIVLRLMTDFFLPKDNIVVSVDETKNFSTLLGMILKKVAMKDMKGHCLYICKGNNPPVPKTPLLPADMKKSPKQLKIKVGTYIAIKKENFAAQKKAQKVAEKEKKLEEEDPEAAKKLEKQQRREQKQELALQEAIRTAILDPGNEDGVLPKELFLKLVMPTLYAAALTTILSHVGMWIHEPKHFVKVLMTLVGVICGAQPTYYGERQERRRVAEFATAPPKRPLRDLAHLVSPQQIKVLSDQSHLFAFFEKMKTAYLAKPGDVVDELLSGSLVVAPDLTDQELALALAVGVVHEHDAAPLQHSFLTWVRCSLGVHGADMDRILLNGTPDAARLSDGTYKPYNDPHSKVVSQAMMAAAEVPDGKNAEAIAKAWAVVERNVKWIFQAAALAGDAPGGSTTLHKGMTHLSTPYVTHAQGLKRGTVFAMPGFVECSTQAKVAEEVVKKGLAEATAKPKPKAAPPPPEPAKPKKKAAKPAPPPKKEKKEDVSGTLQLKITKVPTMHDMGAHLPYDPCQHPAMLSPFTVLEVAASRPNDKLSANSFDIDLKFKELWALDDSFKQTLLDDAERASLRLLLKTRVPETFLVVVLGVAIGTACIGPVLEAKEAECKRQLGILVGSIVLPAVSCALAAAHAEEARAARLKKEEEEREKANAEELAAREKEEANLKRQQERQAREREREREEEEAERRKQEEHEKLMRLLEQQKKKKKTTPSGHGAPAITAPRFDDGGGQQRRRNEVDWIAEELMAMRAFEKRMEERRTELDRWDKNRKRDAAQWERIKMEEIEKAAKKRTAVVQRLIREQEAMQQKLFEKNKACERRIGESEKEIERRHSALKKEVEDFEQRRRELEEERALGVANLERIAQQHTASRHEVAKENEALRAKVKEHARRAGDLRSQLEATANSAGVEGATPEDAAEHKASADFAPVLAWLGDIGLARFADAFAGQGHTLQSVCKLAEADLNVMQVAALGPRRRLLLEADILRTKLEAEQAAAEKAKKDVGDGEGLITKSRGALSLRRVLIEFYAKFDPAKVPQVAMILQKFHGKYDELFATLASIYPIYFPSPYRDRTAILARRVNPELLPAVDVLLDLHRGRERELLDLLLRTS